MPSLRFLLRLAAFPLLLLRAGVAGAAVPLLEPVGGQTQIDTGNINYFITYFNAVLPWVTGVAAGIAVVWGIWGATGIILSGGDPAKATEGKNKVIASLTGLILLLFARMLLRTINASFFV